MFDVGFSELCMVGLVSLLVIGPEKLPKVARIAGFWLGKTRNMVATVKAEIKQELQAEEMRQLLQEQTQLYNRLETEAMSVQGDVLNELQQAQSSLMQKIEPDISLASSTPVELVRDLHSAPSHGNK